MRHKPRSPVAIGLIALAVILVLVFLGSTKDIPFTKPYEVNAVFQSANSIRPGSPVPRGRQGQGSRPRRAPTPRSSCSRSTATGCRCTRTRRPRSGRASPRGQLLRRPQVGLAVGARARGRRHDQGHADRHAGPARRGADRGAVRLAALYEPELTAFFANTPAATNAKDTQGIHYLRTTNPLNAEDLAVYPRRIGTNRPNAYAKPRSFSQLRRGMPVFDDRHCGAGVPDIGNTPAVPLPPLVDELIAEELLNRIVQFAFAGQPGTNGHAPPCRLQGPYSFGGEVTQYPHGNER